MEHLGIADSSHSIRKTLVIGQAEAYLRPCQTSMTELFCENSEQFKVGSHMEIMRDEER